jgi:hypothetical protein
MGSTAEGLEPIYDGAVTLAATALKTSGRF